ncbi:MAG: DUF3656 domain-containing protein, partial [Victivallaceae bacterium]|nr:DUF3656 domain-containing protein [Victivallaceae bacterium]
MKNPIELLSPAGNAETALAAFDAGADAVYCGLGRFNARARAENFTPDTMAALVGFAHERGKKVYVTLNTLIYESELPELAELLAEISRICPDALIVQDLGVAEMARRYFPRLVLHASTQLGIHNSAGVEAARKLGFKRVILERQVSLDELEKIAEKSPLELEVFIHGSLCCSLSGRCLLSHHLYGAGGNRGVCKQPCRRRYDGEYRLSLPDLVGTSYLDRLREMKIASLKIEGRLRPPEYVWKCTRAYRMLLDAPETGGEAVVREAENLLASASGRSGGNGFFDPHGLDNMIDPKTSGIFGIGIGTVRRASAGQITLTLENKLHLGDRLRIVPSGGGAGETFSLTSMRDEKGTALLRAKPGAVVEIATAVRAQKGMRVLKIGENGFDFSRRVKKLPPRRETVDLKIRVGRKMISVTSSRLDAPWICPVAFPEARNRPSDAESVRKIFSSGMPENFRAGTIDVEIDGALFLPVGVLKTLRREFWLAVSGAWRTPSDDAAAALEKWERDEAARPLFSPPEVDFSGAGIVPGFLPERDVAAAEKRFREILRGTSPLILLDGIYPLGWMDAMPENARVGCRFPVAVTNHLAADALKRFGVSAVETAPELPGKERDKLSQRLALQELDGHDTPLLVTRARLTSGIWR